MKLAVVHAPVGPQKGPGLDENLQSPGIEDAHMYPGPRKYDYWDPYGGQGNDNFDETSINPSRKKRRKQRKDSKARKVAIDFDGTITAAPWVIKKFMQAVIADGGECHLVTGRPIEERAFVDEFTNRYGMKFSHKHFYPIAYKYSWVGWDTLLDVRIGRWKAGLLDELGIDVVVDDNDVYIQQIVSRLPNIFVLKPIGG